MEVGDYVRTKYLGGSIEKIIEIIPKERTVDEKERYLTDISSTFSVMIEEQDIIKSSPNIIDLIEVGDYVNEQKVFDKLYDEKNACWYLKLEIGEVFGKYARTYEQHIKSTVTKEQFEAMEYKVEV